MLSLKRYVSVCFRETSELYPPLVCEKKEPLKGFILLWMQTIFPLLKNAVLVSSELDLFSECFS